MKEQYRIVIQLTTIEQTLKNADELLVFAKLHADKANLLSSCAAILLAASLEQGIRTVLDFAAVNYAAENRVDVSQIPYSTVFQKSLRQRMLLTPKLLSDGRFQLRAKNKYVRALHDLISHCNELVHIDEDAELLDEHDKRVTIKDGSMEIRMPIPQNRWDSITPNEALLFQTALKMYFDEVLFPPSNEICQGEIITSV